MLGNNILCLLGQGSFLAVSGRMEKIFSLPFIFPTSTPHVILAYSRQCLNISLKNEYACQNNESGSLRRKYTLRYFTNVWFLFINSHEDSYNRFKQKQLHQIIKMSNMITYKTPHLSSFNCHEEKGKLYWLLPPLSFILHYIVNP